jgi:hypothetical protein
MSSGSTTRTLAIAIAAALIGWQAISGTIALLRDGLTAPSGFRFGDERRFTQLALGKDLPIYAALVERVPEDATIVIVLDFMKLGGQERAQQLELAMHFRNLAWPRRCVAPTDLGKPAIAQRLAAAPSFLLVLDPGAPAPAAHELLAGNDRVALYRRPESGR